MNSKVKELALALNRALQVGNFINRIARVVIDAVDEEIKDEVKEAKKEDEKVSSK